MAGTQLTLDVEDREARKLIARLADEGTGDLVPRLGEYLRKAARDRFLPAPVGQRAPDGTPWQPLKRSYARRKKYNKGRILLLRGYLAGSIRYQPEGEDAAIVGTNSPYGAIHQLGGTIEQPARPVRLRFRTVAGRKLFAGRRHKRVTEQDAMVPAHQVRMPARPFLGVSADDERHISQILGDWVRERAAGRRR